MGEELVRIDMTVDRHDPALARPALRERTGSERGRCGRDEVAAPRCDEREPRHATALVLDLDRERTAARPEEPGERNADRERALRDRTQDPRAGGRSEER